MRLETRNTTRGSMMAGNSRKRHHGMLLLLALGAAVLSVVLLQKMRERRVCGLLLQDQDRQFHALQQVFEKEREHSEELKRKLEHLRTKTISLRAQKSELNNKLMEMESTAAYLTKIKNEMDAALEEKQNQISVLAEKAAESTTANLGVKDLTGILQQKEAEIEELKQRLANINGPKQATTEESGNGIAVDDSIRRAEPMENSSNEKTTMQETPVGDAHELARKQEEEIRKEERWVKFETNLDDEGSKNDGGQHDNQAAVDVPSDNQQEKHEVSHESEDSGLEGHKEMGQGNLLEIKQENSENSVSENRDSDKYENSQHENGNQVDPAKTEDSATASSYEKSGSSGNIQDEAMNKGNNDEGSVTAGMSKDDGSDGERENGIIKETVDGSNTGFGKDEHKEFKEDAENRSENIANL